jgi:hypothetical protein
MERPPTAGGDAAFTIRLAASGVSLNDFIGSFALNQIIFSASSTIGTTVTASTGSSLNFVGEDPTVWLQGIAGAAISAPIQVNGTGTGLMIKSTGPGHLTLSGAITEGAQPKILTIDTGSTSPNINSVNLTGTINLTGGVTLNSGNFTISSSLAVITGPINAHAGTLTLANANIGLSNSIILHGDTILRSVGGSTVNHTLSGVISSAVPGAGLVIRTGGNAGTINLSSTSTYIGATTLDYSNAPELAALGGGALTITGSSGSILQTSEINIRAGSTLRLDASSATDNRVAGTTPIHLRSGNLIYGEGTGSGSTRTEVTGAVDGAGYSTVNAFTGSTVGIRLQLTSLARTDRGTFLFRGNNLGTLRQPVWEAS